MSQKKVFIDTMKVSAVVYTTSMSTQGIHSFRLFKKVMEVAQKWIDFRFVFLLKHVGYWPNLDELRG